MAKYLILPIIFAILLLRFLTLDKVDLKDGESISLRTRLTSEPQLKKGSITFSTFYRGNRIFIYTKPTSSYSYGDLLEISGKVKVSLLNKKSTFISMYYPDIKAKKDNLALFYSVRQNIISVFERTLPSDYSSLLLGIVFGIKSSLSGELSNNLKLLGLMHIIAASGMNVTLIAGFLSSILLLFLRRQIALLFTIVGIILYAFLAGLEPSIVRASIMGIIVFTAQILGRQRLASYSLFITAYIMILLSPYVIWDIGFQLSFLATAGLIYIRPLLYKITIFKKILGAVVVGEDVSTTIAAQLVTLPVLLANFGLYSIMSVVINALVLWSIPILMIIGGMGLVVSIVSESLGRAVMYLSIPLLYYFEITVKIFSGFSFVFNLPEVSWPFIAGYYLILLSVFITISLRKHE